MAINVFKTGTPQMLSVFGYRDKRKQILGYQLGRNQILNVNSATWGKQRIHSKLWLAWL